MQMTENNIYIIMVMLHVVTVIIHNTVASVHRKLAINALGAPYYYYIIGRPCMHAMQCNSITVIYRQQEF